MKKLLICSLGCTVFSLSAFADEIDVTSLADSGQGTLRDALLIAQDQDQIIFDPSLTGVVTLLSSLPPVSAEVNIIGPSSGGVSIDGGSSFQIFQIEANALISNLTLTNPDPTALGGAITIGADFVAELDQLTISHCSSGCEAPIEIQAGGVLYANQLFFSPPSSTGGDINFESGSVALFSNDTTIQPTINVGGSGLIFKEGSGYLSIYGSSNPVDLALVCYNGTLNFNGNATELMLTAPNGIILGGNSVYFVNEGTLAPSTITGTMQMISIQQDFMQTDTGNLVIQVDSSGNSDLIRVGGNAYVSGTLTIVPNGTGFTLGTTYPFLTTGGATTGEFSVVSTNSTVSFIVIYTSDVATIEVVSVD